MKNAETFVELILLTGLISSCQSDKHRHINTKSTGRPNIVFILTDDQAWNVLGKDGRYPFMKTPNIDRIASEGIVFENAFVTISLSSPSRACIMTGCYAHKHGVFINSYRDPNPEVPFLPKNTSGKRK